MLYLRKCLGNIAKYCSKYLILDIGDPIGHYNVLFSHGGGSSAYYPISFLFIRDMWKTLPQLALRDTPVERVVTSHSHWLTPELELEGFKVSVTGGFQKWEYTIQQRPSGMLLLLYWNGECSIIPIKPDPTVVRYEREEQALEYKNMGYYSQILKEHFKSYEVQ